MVRSTRLQRIIDLEFVGFVEIVEQGLDAVGDELVSVAFSFPASRLGVGDELAFDAVHHTHIALDKALADAERLGLGTSPPRSEPRARGWSHHSPSLRLWPGTRSPTPVASNRRR
jgi:hypothetical protein